MTSEAGPKVNMAAVMTSYPSQFVQEHELDKSGLSEIPYGRQLKKAEFSLRDDYIFLNHGSYGAVPKRVMAIQQRYNEEREDHPELWFRLNARQYLDKTRHAIATFINANPDNVFVVNNATTAMNIFVKSFPFKAGDAILDSTTTYGAVMNLVSDFTQRLRPDVKRIHLDIPFPIQSEDEVVSKYEAILDSNPNIRVAIIDHITSPSSILMPISRLVELCHRRGVLVFVDGAHAIGQVSLDMTQLQPDVYTSNLHKWTFSPRGAAFVWFAEQHRSWLNPPNSSWHLGGPLALQFFDQGTRDHVPLICSRHGLEFYHAIGGMEKIAAYTSKLASEAQKLLCAECNLEPGKMPRSMEAPNMKLVKLPKLPNMTVDDETLWKLHKDLFGNSNIFGILVTVQGEFYFRLSAQVYNEIQDYKDMAALLKSFLEKLTKA